MIHRLIHNSIVLTIHALSSLALTFFPKVDDRMAGRIFDLDLYLVERIVAFGARHLGVLIVVHIVSIAQNPGGVKTPCDTLPTGTVPRASGTPVPPTQ